MNAPSPSPELLRRQRVFIAGIFVLAVCEAAGMVYYFADPARPRSAFAFFLAAGLAVLVWSIAGARWIRAAQPDVVADANEAAARARQRDGFVRRHGTLGFGLAWGILMSLWNAWGALTTQPLSTGVLHLAGHLALNVPLGLLGGYLWGRLMWGIFPAWPAPSDAKPRA